MKNRIIEYNDRYIICNDKLEIALSDTSDIQETAETEEEKTEFLRKIKIPEKSRRLKKMIILLSTACNMRCRYCYLSFGTHAGDETIHNIKVDDINKTLKLILEKFPEGIGFIQFFGGEPLMAFNEMQSIYHNVCDLFDEKGLEHPKFGVVTNGLRLDDKVIDFFNESKMVVTFSIDGDKEIHDKTRKKITPDSAFDDLSQRLLKYKGKMKFPHYYEMTLNREHILMYKEGIFRQWLDAVMGLGLNRGIIGIIEYSMDHALDLKEEDLPIMEKIYKEFVDYYFEKLDSDEITMYNLDICRSLLAIIRKDFTPFCCSAGITQLTVATNGVYYPCPKFATIDYSIGSAEKGCIEKCNIKDIIESDKREMCQECWMRNICKSYCYSLKYRKKEGQDVLPTRCIHLDLMFTNIIRNLVIRKENGTLNDVVRRARYILENYDL